jgi:YjbE family integral membrane protein
VTTSFWVGLASIIGIDLVLAGDNAVVVAMAARNLSRKLQRRAIVIGTLLAVVLRIVLTSAVVLVLRVPAVRIVGGLVLLWIAWKMSKGDDTPDVDSADELRTAIRTIVTADLIMSLDNVLAVAGAARGSILLIVIGLAISIPVVMGGATVVLRLLERLPAIVWFGVALIAWTGASLIIGDPLVRQLLGAKVPELTALALDAVVTVAVTLAAWLATRKSAR